MDNHTQKFITAGQREPRLCNKMEHIKEEHKYKCEAIEAKAGYGDTVLCANIQDG